MKNRALPLVILLLPFALFLFFWLSPGAVKTSAPGDNPPGPAAAVTNRVAGQNTNSTSTSTVVASAPPPEPADSPRANPATEALFFTNFSPVTVLQNMSRAIHQYSEMFGGNPVGTNPEITRQLGGGNPKHVNFISAEAGLRVNENGELVDPWGTPYFFHQLSGREMEIHSAGPDRIMWTGDDLVAK